jgi:hypothetical protein
VIISKLVFDIWNNGKKSSNQANEQEEKVHR